MDTKVERFNNSEKKTYTFNFLIWNLTLKGKQMTIISIFWKGEWRWRLREIPCLRGKRILGEWTLTILVYNIILYACHWIISLIYLILLIIGILSCYVDFYHCVLAKNAHNHPCSLAWATQFFKFALGFFFCVYLGAYSTTSLLSGTSVHFFLGCFMTCFFFFCDKTPLCPSFEKNSLWKKKKKKKFILS